MSPNDLIQMNKYRGNEYGHLVGIVRIENKKYWIKKKVIFSLKSVKEERCMFYVSIYHIDNVTFK